MSGLAQYPSDPLIIATIINTHSTICLLLSCSFSDWMIQVQVLTSDCPQMCPGGTFPRRVCDILDLYVTGVPNVLMNLDDHG